MRNNSFLMYNNQKSSSENIDNQEFLISHIPHEDLFTPQRQQKKLTIAEKNNPNNDGAITEITYPSIIHRQTISNKLYRATEAFIYDDSVNSKGKFLCKSCLIDFRLHFDLIEHYNEQHKDYIDLTKASFTSLYYLEEFLRKVLKTCKQTIILYNTVHKKKSTFKYYKCKYIWNGYKTCPYFITIQIKSRNNISIKHSLVHSHNPDFNQVSIPPFVKNKLINKLKMGISIERVWRELTSNLEMNSITSREETISKNYLYYLKSKYLQIDRIHDDDETNFNYLVNEYLKLKKINIYRLSTIKSKTVGDNENNNFVACFNTPFMQENFEKYHSKGIFFDSTHSTNRYGLLLVVGFVINSLHVSVPFIFILTTSENENTLITCFKAFLDNLDFKPDIPFFMSDMYPGFYNAWVKASQIFIQYLYCYYHLRRAWNLKLNNLVSNIQTKKKAANMINTMMNMTKEREFCMIYQKFISYIRRNCKAFYSYFMKKYANHIERWALYLRLNAIANTNNACESFFSMFKRLHLQSNIRSRLDNLFVTPEDCSTRMSIQYILTLQSNRKNTLGYRFKKARENHHKSHDLNESKIFQITPSIYTFKNYEIRVMVLQCDKCPKMECEECQLCSHMISCTCMNYIKSKLLCKHIHKVYDCYLKSERKNIMNGKICLADQNVCYSKSNKRVTIKVAEFENNLDVSLYENTKHFDKEKEQRIIQKLYS